MHTPPVRGYRFDEFSLDLARRRLMGAGTEPLPLSGRAFEVLAFLLAPKTEVTMLIFAAAIGLTYLSTIPPTVGLVAKFYGTANMGTLFGLVMLSHQIGGFLGAYMGGKAFEWTGSYNWLWYADIVLAVGAALINLPIREAHVRRVPQPA